ncbi:MAG TPA: hypothetical protein VMW25_01950 [Clostridia bacterium]|nr:hypothetical protein [Clostridia bacterium]
MSKFKFFILTKALLFLFLFVPVFGILSKTAMAKVACNSECAFNMSCSSPDCVDCQWCSKSEKSLPDLSNPILPRALSELSGVAFFQKALSVAVNLAFVIGGLVFFFLLIAGAIKWITSGGDKASLESAQKTITNALIGLAILLSVFVIISLIEQLFGVNITSFKLPTLAQ